MNPQPSRSRLPVGATIVDAPRGEPSEALVSTLARAGLSDAALGAIRGEEKKARKPHRERKEGNRRVGREPLWTWDVQWIAAALRSLRRIERKNRRLRVATSDSSEESEPRAEDGRIVGVVSAAGAILVVGLGLAFVFVLALVSLKTVPADQRSTLVAGAFTVLGTVVGMYFGVRAGSAGKERAEAAREAETLKVQELAASVDPATATEALDRAEQRAETARSASSPSMPAL